MACAPESHVTIILDHSNSCSCLTHDRTYDFCVTSPYLFELSCQHHALCHYICLMHMNHICIIFIWNMLSKYQSSAMHYKTLIILSALSGLHSHWGLVGQQIVYCTYTAIFWNKNKIMLHENTWKYTAQVN